MNPTLISIRDDLQNALNQINRLIATESPTEPVPFDPPYVPVEPSGFMVPTGTYRGRRLNELDNDTLRNLYNGFKGCGKRDVADQIMAEIHLRQGNMQ